MDVIDLNPRNEAAIPGFSSIAWTERNDCKIAKNRRFPKIKLSKYLLTHSKTLNQVLVYTHER